MAAIGRGALLLLLASGSAALWASPPRRARQFVLFDVTFSYTKEDADNSKPSPSHWYVKGDKINPDRPKDWTSPVDYRNGTAHIRLEVLEKPEGGQPTTWNICYIPNKPNREKGGYGCMKTETYREKGVYESDVPMTKFWQHEGITWTEGIRQMDLVIKDDKNLHAHKRPDPEKFFPTKIRLSVTQVPAGAKYEPK
jgi:hypothetical protein